VVGELRADRIARPGPKGDIEALDRQEAELSTSRNLVISSSDRLAASSFSRSGMSMP
jgi:hypothetical protein